MLSFFAVAFWGRVSFVSLWLPNLSGLKARTYDCNGSRPLFAAHLDTPALRRLVWWDVTLQVETSRSQRNSRMTCIETELRTLTLNKCSVVGRMCQSCYWVHIPVLRTPWGRKSENSEPNLYLTNWSNEQRYVKKEIKSKKTKRLQAAAQWDTTMREHRPKGRRARPNRFLTASRTRGFQQRTLVTPAASCFEIFPERLPFGI